MTTMTAMTRAARKILPWATALLLSCGALWAAYQALQPAPPELAAWAPQGACIAIEARDFSALLRDWSNSAESRAWLAGEDYQQFSRSRLFSRLNEAQQQFAASAGLAADRQFLAQVAGQQSLFAWYDIGKLEFLYITDMPGGAAARSSLVQQQGRFEVRKAGADTFYVRSLGDPQRTVAFAVRGDYLLLATREDLLANALLLMQKQAHLALKEEHWYAAATSAAKAPAGDLRMTLNLTAIVPSPYFRNYWVQRNISEMKQYTAALSDLYRTPAAFREERVLLPKSVGNSAAAVDMAPLLACLPADSGVYRAIAHPATDQMVATLGDKLLFREIAEYRDAREAPVADLSPQEVGSTTDLETRIDAEPLPSQPRALALAPLRALLDTAHVDAILEASSSGDAPGQLFLPIRSTVVLSSPAPWPPAALQSALVEALRGGLTAGENGLAWRSRSQDGLEWFELQGLQPLAFAVQGNRWLLASDSDTLLKSLERRPGANAPAQLATVAAGFNLSAERARFARLTSLLDRSQAPDPAGLQPALFSANMRSLSDTFAALDTETFVQQPAPGDHAVRQTVVYRWRQER